MHAAGEIPDPEDHGAWIPYLIRKRRFAECMILAWQSVEDGIKQMTVQEFNLTYQRRKLDPRVDLVRDSVGFKSKVVFLMKMGRLCKSDVKSIREFYEERNNLFHGSLFDNTHPISVSENEKTRLMELASKVSQIVVNRGFGVCYDQGTGDLHNKDIPKPQRPRWATIHDERVRQDILRFSRKENIS